MSMIPRTSPSCQSESEATFQNWQKEMANSFRDPDELLRYLELSPDCYSHLASSQFTFRATRSYCQRIEKGNPEDPLLKQILPIEDETQISPGYSTNPVGDSEATILPGLLHKYRGRVLFITTPACSIHCRYCFRRHFPYQENHGEEHWQPAIDYISQSTDISEVILSGGDPLSLTEQKLTKLTDQLQHIPHIKTLRIHSRMPVVLPERISPHFIEWLNTLPWNIVMVIHSNHANEIDTNVAGALLRLKQVRNMTLLNQSVLLAGINDSATALGQLSQRLFESHVLPYYLHTLDKVVGASHFEVNDTRAMEIIIALRDSLPGYLVPRLVREIPGESSKSPLLSDKS